MGDFGGALLSTVEAPPSLPLKAGALHVENAQSPGTLDHTHALQDPIDQLLQKMSSEAGTSLKLVDSPMQNATPAEPATPSRTGSPEPQTMMKDFAAASAGASKPRTVRSSNASSFKPPTPIRSYREPPRLWIHDGPNAGKAMAEWKHNYAPILYAETRDLTAAQRTKFFDRLEASDSERYHQAIAALYWLHPELLPERETDPRTLRKQEEAMQPNSPRHDREQQECFNGWNNWGPRTTPKPREVGPHGEETPDVKKEDLKASCQHCEQEKIKQGTLRYKLKSALSFGKKEEDQLQTAVEITVLETGPEEEEERRFAAIDLDENKENEACTEIVANKAIAPAVVKPKRSSVFARMRSSVALGKA